MHAKNSENPLVSEQPAIDAPVSDWVGWYWSSFLPAWVARAHDPAGIGFFDALDLQGDPVTPQRRSVLAQARLLFTFAHLALKSDNPAYTHAARIARDALPGFAKAPGLSARAVTQNGAPTGDAQDALATSYDQTFVILGLSTWGKLHPEEDVTDALEACWHALSTTLTDPATGLLLEHDAVPEPAAPDAPNRAQNPHMHLYEAALQAFEMTGKPIWLSRAGQMREIGLAHFFDRETGSLIEFIAPDLTQLPGRDGQRREIGHQCEWAWLLLREAELGGGSDGVAVAARLLEFADRYGFATSGPLKGAAFDAVSSDASWREDRFLLWPQTEAIKAHAVRADRGDYAERAQALCLTMFQRYFAGHAAFVNQLDATGQPLWPEVLSRLHYHIVLALTEGARAGLWQGPEA